MNKFKDEEKYTNLRQSKILEPIMDKLGVEADAEYIGNKLIFKLKMARYLYDDCDGQKVSYRYIDFGGEEQSVVYDVSQTVKAYRLDTLLWVLPDWVTNSLCHLMCAVTEEEKLQEFNSEVPKVFCTSGCLHANYVNLVQGIFILKGSKAIAAATELIKLLYDTRRRICKC